jgi:hypothetical protein
MWVDAEEKKNDFQTLRLPWYLHPERDARWREEQTKQLGQRGAAQECDTDFLTSGDNVVDLLILKEYEDKRIRDPIEVRRGQSLWIFDAPKADKDYMVCADTARGDGSDFSAAHVLELDTVTQVAEFKDQLTPAEFGDLLVSLATEYNDALLVVERTGGLGWATLQQIINRQYKNTFYSSSDLKIVDIHRQHTNKYHSADKKLLPGCETSIATRPLVISKIDTYFRNRAVDIRSIRTINELKTFIWDGGKPQAAKNYNDDLVMALGFGLWTRDMALRLKQEGILLTKSLLDKIHIPQPTDNIPIYTAKSISTGKSQWEMKTGGKSGDVENLTWLLR